MKKIFALFAALILLPLAANAAQYKEGTHYQTVKKTATATPEVMEFFSFYCPHCASFEPLMETLKANLSKDVKVKKNHVNFLGKAMGPELTNAYAAAEILQVEDKVTEIIFDKIHTQRKAINGEKDIIDIFVEAGVSAQEAKNALVSFPVKGLASQMQRDTETFQISGVPTIIVNGKYKVNTGSVKSTEEFIALVDFLTKKND